MMRYLLLLLLLTGCGPHSAKGVRRDGEQLMRRLTSQLEQVRSREELLHALPQLRGTLLAIAHLAVEADQILSSHEVALPIDPEINQRLRQELIRVYALDGGREMIESAGADALNHLVHAELR